MCQLDSNFENTFACSFKIFSVNPKLFANLNGFVKFNAMVTANI